MEHEGYKQEVILTWGAILAGLVFAVMLWGGRHPMNLVYTWVPQAVVLVVMSLLGARPAAVGGAALGFAGYLAFFHWWVMTYYATDGLVWLLYLFSLPGGFVAGIGAASRFDRLDVRPPLKAGLTTAAFVIAGIAINQFSVHIALSS